MSAIYHVTVSMEGQTRETGRERSPLACHEKDMTKKRKQKNPEEFPIATVAFYGPDDRHATKVVVGILKREDSDVDPIMCFFGQIATDGPVTLMNRITQRD